MAAPPSYAARFDVGRSGRCWNVQRTRLPVTGRRVRCTFQHLPERPTSKRAAYDGGAAMFYFLATPHSSVYSVDTVASGDPSILLRVRVTESEIVADLSDGRVISAPLAWSWRQYAPGRRDHFTAQFQRSLRAG